MRGYLRINTTAATIQDRLRDGERLLDVERWLFEALLALGRQILEHALRSLLAEQSFVRAAREKAKTLKGAMRSKGRTPVTLKTLFGNIRVHTTYWVEQLKGSRGPKRKKRRKSGSGLYPVLWI